MVCNEGYTQFTGARMPKPSVIQRGDLSCSSPAPLPHHAKKSQRHVGTGVSKISFFTRWQSMYVETVLMIEFAWSSLVMTQRVTWFSASGVPTLESSLICTIAL